MEILSDLAIVLKNIRYAERDQVVTLLSENHGKCTSLAKGSVHSKRFGGSLAFLGVAQVRLVKKGNSELHRLDEAVFRHEFKNIPKDVEALSSASCMVDLCLRLLEERSPTREVFVALSNALFVLDQGKPPLLILCAFMAKLFLNLGYAPRMHECSICAKAMTAEVTSGATLYWSTHAGGVVCSNCGRKDYLQVISQHQLLVMSQLFTMPFKELHSEEEIKTIYEWFVAFMQQHIPALNSSGGLKSFQFYEDLAGF